MLAFFDESGHPHPRDASTRPVCVTVCISEKSSHFISGRLHALKRDITGREDAELKAKRLLTRGTFRRIMEKRELVEAFFDLVRNLPITVFAVIMDRPLNVPDSSHNHLPSQFRYLLQRCDLFAQETAEMVTILFDGDCSFGNLSLRFNRFLYRSNEGRVMSTITDAPFFVDSRVTAGIQIADMVAGVVRIYAENDLHKGVPTGDSFLSAIQRYYKAIQEKTKDQTSPEGWPRAGIYFMPEKDHYQRLYEEDTDVENA